MGNADATMGEGGQARRLRLDDQLCFALYAATHAVTRAYRPRLAAIDLTYTQYLVMLALWQDGPLTQSALAARLRMGTSAMPPLIDHLERAGAVRRRRDGPDRRVVVVEPTEAGAALERAAALAQVAVECRTGLDPHALARLRDELIALADRTADADASRRRGGDADDPVP